MITFTTKTYKVSSMLSESIVPSIGTAINVQNTQKVLFDDYEGLFVGYGKRDTCYPYTEQNSYTKEADKDINVAILENEFLYAEFLVDYGARLWVLKNKKTGRDLLYTNDVIRFKNLSLRNAWFSGGVEWNIGVVGHNAFTCEKMYAAKVVGANNEDVLRFYEFERVREVYYQLDFWLENEKLFARVRLENPNNQVVPMYWWSNIASPEYNGGRLIVDAASAFSNSDGAGIIKTNTPIVNDGSDVSFYENIKYTIDYFFDISKKSNKFIANVDSFGKGLLQISSNMLQGRKLFSWGHTQGGDHWQEMLTDKAGDYVEIQAGLGKTQYECVPMPPKTCFEWVEVYTDISVTPELQRGEYKELVKEVNRQVKDKICSESLDDFCSKTKSDIALRKGEIVFFGSGYGYLKNLAEGNAPKHLEFSPCKKSQSYFDLLKNGEYSPEIRNQVAFAQEKYQIKLLTQLSKQGSSNWNVYYQLAVYYAFEKDFEKAEEYCIESMTFDNNFLNNHLLAFILHNTNGKNYLYFAKKTIQLKGDNYSVAESIMKLFVDTEKYDDAIEIYSMLNEEIAKEHRLKMYLSMCYFKKGNFDKAEEILIGNGGLTLLDFREGDKFLNNLYKGIRHAKYGERLQDIIVPLQFDFVVAKDD